MILEGLIESGGTTPAQVIETVRRMAEREIVGVLVGLATFDAVQELIERAEAALSEAQERLLELEAEQAKLAAARDQAEDALNVAKAKAERVSFAREMQAGSYADKDAIRAARAVALEAAQEAERVYSRADAAARDLRVSQLPAARAEIKRLDALLRAFRQIERPDLVVLRGVLEKVLADG